MAISPRNAAILPPMSDTQTHMATLILKHATKNRLGTIDWGPNDFDVCEGPLRWTNISVAAGASRPHLDVDDP
jgi:hypothetical protein